MKFKQIATGTYTYRDYNGNMESSHAVYGLGEDGLVYKYIPKKCIWILLEETGDFISFGK